MRRITVPIEVAESDELKKLWYEYNASTANLSYLMRETGLEKSYLQMYLNTSDERWVKCEMLKEALAKKYKTEEVDLSKFDYSFDFDEHTIVFTEAVL